MNRQLATAIALTVACTSLSGCIERPHTIDKAHDTHAVTATATYPHNTDNFTQGLEFDPDHRLVESTGLHDDTKIVRYLPDMSSSETVFYDESHDVFGEGFSYTSSGDIIQLTWQEKEGFLRDGNNFEEKDSFTYSHEGWGICRVENTDVFAVSDGSATLHNYIQDNGQFAEDNTKTVTYNNTTVTGLNELECVGDYVYANVFGSDKIVRINTRNYTVDKIYDLSDIVRQEGHTEADNVLNGIAYDNTDDSFIVTGKRWNKLYRVHLD